MVKRLKGFNGYMVTAGVLRIRSIECEFDHLFRVERGLTIGDAFAGSHDGLRNISRGNAQRWSSGLRAERVRADSRQAATEEWGLRSIECEFDHLFRVERGLTIGDASAGSQHGLRNISRGNAQGWPVGLRAEKVRGDSRQAATEKWGLRSIECEFDHLFRVEGA
jgi:hypothetical protein